MDKLSTHSIPRFPSLNPILVDDDVEDDDADDDAMDGGIDRCTRARTTSPSPSSYLFVVGHWASRQQAWKGCRASMGRQAPPGMAAARASIS